MTVDNVRDKVSLNSTASTTKVLTANKPVGLKAALFNDPEMRRKLAALFKVRIDPGLTLKESKLLFPDDVVLLSLAESRFTSIVLTKTRYSIGSGDIVPIQIQRGDNSPAILLVPSFYLSIAEDVPINLNRSTMYANEYRIKESAGVVIALPEFSQEELRAGRRLGDPPLKRTSKGGGGAAKKSA